MEKSRVNKEEHSKEPSTKQGLDFKKTSTAEPFIHWLTYSLERVREGKKEGKMVGRGVFAGV